MNDKGDEFYGGFYLRALLIFAAAVIAANGMEGWGWFLAVAVLI